MALNREAPPVDDTVTDVSSKPAGAAGESLADLVREADFLDVAPENAQLEANAAHAERVTQSNVGELLAALTAVRAMVFPVLGMVVEEKRLQMLGNVWNDGVLAQGAEAGAAVLELHGITLGSLMGRYGAYVMLAAAFGPPALMTKKILDMPADKPAQKAADGQQQ